MKPWKKARRLLIDDATWWYQVGVTTVILLNPEGKKSHYGIIEVSGKTGNTLECGRWKKTSDGMVTPNHIRKFIKQKLS